MLLRFCSAALGIAAAGAWTYASPRAWPAADNHCGDSRGQSPIDIVVDRAASSEGAAALVFQGAPGRGDGGGDGGDFGDDAATDAAMVETLETNGHTWEVAWDHGQNATEMYGVEWQGKTYRLAQYHYHSPSEHTVHGAHFDMEAHHVHYCVSSNCLTPQQDDEILVVAVFLRMGPENAYLQTFWNDFGPADVGVTNLHNPYEHFLPDNKAYYSYTGSTTTPPCVPNVNWVLMQEAVTLSGQQLTAYRTNISSLPQTAPALTSPLGVTPGWDVLLGANNRPLQALGVRTVSVYNAQDSSTASSTAWSRQMKIATFCAAGGLFLLLIGLVVYCARQIPKQKDQGNKRAVKRTRALSPPVPPAPPPAAQPLMVQMVQPQPLMQAMPMAATSPTRFSGAAIPTAQYMQMGQRPLPP